MIAPYEPRPGDEGFYPELKEDLYAVASDLQNAHQGLKERTESLRVMFFATGQMIGLDDSRKYDVFVEEAISSALPFIEREINLNIMAGDAMGEFGPAPVEDPYVNLFAEFPSGYNHPVIRYDVNSGTYEKTDDLTSAYSLLVCGIRERGFDRFEQHRNVARFILDNVDRNGFVKGLETLQKEDVEFARTTLAELLTDS